MPRTEYSVFSTGYCVLRPRPSAPPYLLRRLRNKNVFRTISIIRERGIMLQSFANFVPHFASIRNTRQFRDLPANTDRIGGY